MCVLFVVCCMCGISLSFEVDQPFSGQSVLWDQRGYCMSIVSYSIDFLTQKNSCHCTGQSLSLTTCHLSYCIPRILALGSQWSIYRNSFCQSRLLTTTLWPFQPPIQCTGHDSMTLWPFSLPFNAQVMIHARSYWFLNLASTSIYGCYFYLIIYYGMS